MKSATDGLILRLILGAVLAAMLIFAPTPLAKRLDDLERYTIDRRFERRGPLAPDPNLLIIGIDQESLRAEKRPTSLWNPVFAELFEGLASAGTRAVFLDLIYDARYDPALRALVKSHLESHQIEVPRHVLNRMGFDVPLIQACISAQARGLKIVLGYFSDQEVAGDFLHVFQASEKAFVNLAADPDSVCRQAVIFGRSPADGKTLPSVALSLASMARQGPWHVSASNLVGIGSHSVTTLRQAREGQINFRGPRGTFPMLPAHQVLQEIRTSSPELSRFRNKTVLIGLWTFDDVKTTPFGLVQGVEIHADITDNLINDRFLITTPWYWSGFCISLFFLGQTAAFHFGIRLAMLLSALLFTGWIGAGVVAFKQGYLIELVRPGLFIFLFGGLESFRVLYGKQREVRKVRQLFRRYVNEQVIESFLQQPWEQVLQGKRQRICVMIIDIRGFTTLSETLDPQVIVEFLNRHFSRVTTIIMDHGGVVDKFLGDGVLAFFNAPVPQPGFPLQAVKAARLILAAAGELEIRSGDRSFAPKIGIGLHLGDAIVGNIGSEKKMEFTAIGDTVNTTSRIEGLNKELGTAIIATEPLVQETRNEFGWHDLGEHRLRGREQPLRLYTIRD